MFRIHIFLIIFTSLLPFNLLAKPLANKIKIPPQITQFKIFSQAELDNELKSQEKDYDSLLKLATEIQLHQSLYQFLNEQFVEYLKIPEDRQKLFGWAPQIKGLTETQILLLLLGNPDLVKLTQQYIDHVPRDTKDKDLISQEKIELKRKFQEIVQSQPGLLTRFKDLADPTKPLNIASYNGKSSIDKVEVFVNHPIYVSEVGQKMTKPASDLREEVIKFISGAQQELTANFFDFDLKLVAESFINKSKKSVRVRVGIDNAVIETKPEVKEVATMFEAEASDQLKLFKVNAVGLNHMKIIIRDPNGPKAAVMLLSGNLTQSCIGPEGDLIQLPESQRPVSSVPNANHAIIIYGRLPAIVARHQINKIFDYGFRGQSGFPLGGAYKFYESPQGAAQVPNWMLLAFSPNGGMGDINNDILKQVILSTRGPIRLLQFAFSSKSIVDALVLRAQMQGEFDYGGLGDSSFAMRDFSAFLPLIGFGKNIETQKYEDSSYGMAIVANADKLSQLRQQFFLAPEIYGEKYTKINGQFFKTTSKIHHKVMIVPQQNMTVAGTSFNFSANAETNNEQIAVFSHPAVTQAMMGAYDWLVDHAKGTIYQEALRRNQTGATDSPVDSESKF